MNSAEVLIKFKGDTTDADKKTSKLSSAFGGLTKSIAIGNLVSGAVSKGLEVMTSHMDSAIKRIDTMENFPKVMQNFGVGADEANESIKRIDKSVQGLPTSLDQAVAGVQDIFMVSKDLKGAENMFKAINDSAMVFANGSTEAVDRFIYGYKQALSAGKVSAQDFNQMNEAIPGLMSKVAEKMGVSYKDLKEGLSNGSISIDQFNTALKGLDTEGVGSMKSLSESAKTSTGGIQTSISNMKTAFTRGVADIIKSVDEALKPFGGLSGVISSLGKIGEQAFKMIGEVLKMIMPMLINIAKSIMPVLQNTFNKIMPSLQKIGEALLPAIGKIIEKLVPVLAHIIESILPIVMATLDAIIPLIDPLADFILALIDCIMALAEPMLWIAQQILPPIIKILGNLIKSILPPITNGIKVLTNVLNAWFNFVKPILSFIYSAIGKIFNFIKNNWKLIFSFLVNPIGTAFNLLYNKCEAFRNFVNGFVEKIKSFFSGLKNGVVNAVNGIVNGIKSIPGKISNIAGKIFNLFTSLPKKMGSIGLDIVKGIGNGITNGINWIKNKIKSFVGNVTSFIKKMFKIGSPSKLMADQVGQWLPKGIAVGIDDNAKSVYKSLDNLTSDIGINSQLTNSMNNSFTPNFNVYNNVNVEQDPLGQVVSNIKTFSGGAKNDYNYGLGV